MWDSGMWGCGDVGLEDVKTQGGGDMQGLEDMLKDFINKQHIDFYAEFVKYNFWWLNER